MVEEEKTPKEKKQDELKKLILKKVEDYKKGDYFLLLDLTPDATLSDVQESFFSLAKRLHPDKVDQLEIHDLKNESIIAFKAISEAYKILSDRNLRAKYMAGELLENEKKPDVLRRRKEEDAAIFYHKGMLLLQRRKFKEAEEVFYNATKIDSSKAKYHLYLGWSIFQNMEYPEEKRLADSKKYFERALELSQNEAEPYYYLSLYYKATGDFVKQKRFLQDAVTINPKYTEALRELRLLSMRRQKKTHGRIISSITQFFKKK